MFSALAIIVVATILTALGQPTDVQRPTQGYDLSDPSLDFEVIVPLSIAQCEPFLIYYNNAGNFQLDIKTFDLEDDLLFLSFPPGIGYLDWICNIPAGYGFVVEMLSRFEYYTVEVGSSSACLGDLTASDTFYDPQTSAFQSYTQHPAASNSFQLPIFEE
jgi:hypothetical protein